MIEERVVGKKNQFKVIENHLRNFNNYKAGIRNMKAELNYILPSLTPGYEVRENSSGTFTFKSDTEKFAIERIESKRVLQLNEDIVAYELIVQSIEDALKQLEPLERSFVEQRYFQGLSFDRAAIKTGYSASGLYKLRAAIKDKLLISLKNIVRLQV